MQRQMATSAGVLQETVADSREMKGSFLPRRRWGAQAAPGSDLRNATEWSQVKLYYCRSIDTYLQ